MKISVNDVNEQLKGCVVVKPLRPSAVNEHLVDGVVSFNKPPNLSLIAGIGLAFSRTRELSLYLQTPDYVVDRYPANFSVSLKNQ